MHVHIEACGCQYPQCTNRAFAVALLLLLLLLLYCACIAAGVLQPLCPPLGASVLGSRLVAVDSRQNFSIPVHVLDGFGSQVRSGPGSDWVVALASNTTGSSSSMQLSGAVRGVLSGGEVVLRGLSIHSKPNSSLSLSLTAVPPPGSGDKVG